jgi:hypothetical protein
VEASPRSRVYVGLDNVLMEITTRLAAFDKVDAGSIQYGRLAFSATIRESSAEFLRELAEDFDVFVISSFDEELMVQLLEAAGLMRFITGVVNFRIDGFNAKLSAAGSFVLVDALDVFKRDVQVPLDMLHSDRIAQMSTDDYLALTDKHYLRCQFFFAGEEDAQPLTALVPAVRQRLS